VELFVKFNLIEKFATLAVVLVALIFGLGMVKDVVQDRNAYRNDAARSVASSIAGSQNIIGPFMHSACVETWDIKGLGKNTIEERREFMLTALPETLTIKSSTGIESRARSLYAVNVFTLKAQLAAQWPSLEKLKPAPTVKNSRMVCGAPIVMLAVDDPRGLRSISLKVDGEAHKFKAGTFHPSYSRGVHAMLPDAIRYKADAVVVDIDLELVGTQQLSIVPLADTTQVRMQSSWPHPSFGGRFSPAERSISDKGFDASWRITSMASNAGQAVAQGRPACSGSESGDDVPTVSAAAAVAVTAASASATSQAHVVACAETLQVSFVDPVNPYSLSDRATKYGLLFIVLTFLVVGLFELIHKLRVHPVQYFLVGSALSIFFLLLVSLSEHLSFGVAYAVAAAGCIGLLAFYASHMLGGFKRGIPFGAGVALLYGLLFVLLQLEQTALVVGSIALFVVLALVMALTRKFDWYQLGTSLQNQRGGM
jgi:inner membrane protein